MRNSITNIYRRVILKRKAIRILSDIHLEGKTLFEKRLIPFLEPHKDNAGMTNVIALLGDIGYPDEKIYDYFIGTLSRNYDKVYIISGNHEYFNWRRKTDPNIKKYTMEEIDNMIREIALKHNRCKFLQNSHDEFNGTVFSGCTLWTKIEDKQVRQHLEKHAADYRHIYANSSGDIYEKLNTEHTNRMNNDSRIFLSNTLNRFPNENHVFLTHHSPLFPNKKFRTAHSRYDNSLNSVMFHNDMSNFIENNKMIKLWGFGHTHYNTFSKYYNTTVWSNQMGYSDFEITADENRHFYL